MSRVYETAIRIGASITKAFRADALGAAGALKQLAASTKSLETASKAAQAYKKLDDAVRSSKVRYDQASVALRRLEEAERKAGGATKESTAWRKAGEREVASAAREMDRATKAAERNAAALRKLGVDASRLAHEQKRLAAATAFSSARERVFGKRDPKEAVPLMQKAGGQVRGLASEAMWLGTAAAGAGVAMAGLVMHSLKAGDEIGDTADKLGIGSTALQELRYGAQQSGAEVGALDKALAKQAITIGKWKNAKGTGGRGGAMAIPGMQMLGTGGGEGGGGSETDPYKRIGLNAKALASLKPEDQLRKIADGLAKLKTHADKAAVAQEIYGKGVTEMLPFLEEGSAGIDKLSKAAHKYGGIMSPEAIKNADEADKALTNAKMAVFGVSNTLGAALLPTATRVFKEFSTWVAANRGQIQVWAQSAAAWIEGKGIPAILKIGAEVRSFGDKVLWLVNGAAQLVGGFGNLAIVVAAVRLAPLALTLGQIGISGIKAAFALGQFALAAGAGGLSPLLTLGVAFGSIAIAAAAVGVAIWRIVDAVKELGGAGAVWNDLKDFAAHGGMGHMTRTGGGNRDMFEAQQAENQRNLELARARAQGLVGTSAQGGGVQVNVGDISIGGGSRGNVSEQLDQVKAKALEAYDRRAANQRRVAYGG